MSATSYLILPRLEFRGANGQPAWWCTGAPGPMAACGFVHAMMRAAGGPQHAAAVRGVGLVLHDYAMRAEVIKDRQFTVVLPHQLRAASWINDQDYAGEGDSLSAQPTVRGDGVITLVIALDSVAPTFSDRVAGFLRGARFAGGAVHRHDFDASRPLRVDSADEAATMIRSGFSFHDRADLLMPRTEEGERDPLDAFLRATRRRRAADAAVEDGPGGTRIPKPAVTEVSPEPWLTPYLAGLRALTAIEARPMSRDAQPHALAEPLVGLGQFVSLRESPLIPLWSYGRREHDSFTVQTAH